MKSVKIKIKDEIIEMLVSNEFNGYSIYDGSECIHLTTLKYLQKVLGYGYKVDGMRVRFKNNKGKYEDLIAVKNIIKPDKFDINYNVSNSFISGTFVKFNSNYGLLQQVKSDSAAEVIIDFDKNQKAKFDYDSYISFDDTGVSLTSYNIDDGVNVRFNIATQKSSTINKYGSYLLNDVSQKRFASRKGDIEYNNVDKFGADKNITVSRNNLQLNTDKDIVKQLKYNSDNAPKFDYVEQDVVFSTCDISIKSYSEDDIEKINIGYNIAAEDEYNSLNSKYNETKVGVKYDPCEFHNIDYDTTLTANIDNGINVGVKYSQLADKFGNQINIPRNSGTINEMEMDPYISIENKQYELEVNNELIDEIRESIDYNINTVDNFNTDSQYENINTCVNFSLDGSSVVGYNEFEEFNISSGIWKEMTNIRLDTVDKYRTIKYNGDSNLDNDANIVIACDGSLIRTEDILKEIGQFRFNINTKGSFTDEKQYIELNSISQVRYRNGNNYVNLSEVIKDEGIFETYDGLEYLHSLIIKDYKQILFNKDYLINYDDIEGISISNEGVSIGTTGFIDDLSVASASTSSLSDDTKTDNDAIEVEDDKYKSTP